MKILDSPLDSTRYATKRQQLSQLAIPELIDLLASDHLPTRFLAEMCLRDATST